MIPALAILALTGLWHSAAAWHFLLYPERTLRRTTSERPANPIAAEVFRFLGALNAAIAVFALLLMLLPRASMWIALTGYALFNLSQFLVDLSVNRRKLVHGPMFRTILWGDGLFFAVNAIAAACYWGHWIS